MLYLLRRGVTQKVADGYAATAAIVSQYLVPEAGLEPARLAA